MSSLKRKLDATQDEGEVKPIARETGGEEEGETPLIAAAGSRVRDLLNSVGKTKRQKLNADGGGDEFLALSPLGEVNKVKKYPTSPSDADNSSTKAVATKIALSRTQTLPLSPTLRLHNEMLDFAHLITPTPEETSGREQVVHEIKNCCRDLWPEEYGKSVRVDIFGSFLTGLCLPTSDVDVVVFGAIAIDGSKTKPLYRLADKLKRKGVVKYLEVIAKARVPIVKFTHVNGTHGDICFDQPSGPKMGRLIRGMLDFVPGLRAMVLVLKYFLLQRDLNETYKGGVGSFMLQIMCIASIQYQARRLWHQRYREEEEVLKNFTGKRKRAKFHVDRMRDHWKEEPPLDLGTMLLQFLEFYGTQLNYPEVGISVRGQGSLFNKAERGSSWHNPDRPNMLSIENPESPEDDLAKNSYRYQHVRGAFAHSFYLLAAKMTAYQDEMNENALFEKYYEEELAKTETSVGDSVSESESDMELSSEADDQESGSISSNEDDDEQQSGGKPPRNLSQTTSSSNQQISFLSLLIDVNAAVNRGKVPNDTTVSAQGGSGGDSDGFEE
jgi:DNA polymerase sigma